MIVMMKNIKNPSSFIHHANPENNKESIINFEFLFKIKRNDSRTTAIKIGSERPNPAFRFKWGSNAKRDAQTKEYLWSKNFLDTRNTNGIVSVDIPRLTTRIKLEYISNFD